MVLAPILTSTVSLPKTGSKNELQGTTHLSKDGIYLQGNLTLGNLIPLL